MSIELIPTSIPAQSIKPGYKTTEFWFAVTAMILSVLYGSGFIEGGSQADRLLGILAMILTTMGYSVSRGLVKKQS